MRSAPPKQRPRRSVQDVGTPREFLDAVEARFGTITHDLAANASNKVTAAFYGPGSAWPDGLAATWPTSRRALCFLNPPFGDIAPWAEKCAAESAGGSRVLLLVPASVGANWFNEYLRPHAYVLELAPRVKFVGHAAGFPKDLVLAYFGPERLIGRRMWRWKSKAA